MESRVGFIFRLTRPWASLQMLLRLFLKTASRRLYRRLRKRSRLRTSTVIHPDYAGLGMGIKLINATSSLMVKKGYDVWAKFSSTPIYIAMKRQPCWKLQNIARPTKIVAGRNMVRKVGFRQDIKTYSFRFKDSDAISPKQS